MGRRELIPTILKMNRMGHLEVSCHLQWADREKMRICAYLQVDTDIDEFMSDFHPAPGEGTPEEARESLEHGWFVRGATPYYLIPDWVWYGEYWISEYDRTWYIGPGGQNLSEEALRFQQER